jgi:tripartite-type tricarboxylate transporter receptor subunit TctC
MPAPTRRLAAALVGAALAALAAPATVLADATTYPNRPIRMVVPYPPGGTVEVIARTLGEELTRAWGQPVLVESRPGASGNIGVQAVAAAAPDGYTLVIGTQSTHGTNTVLIRDTKHDPYKDFEPITMVAPAPLILVVNPKTPVSNVRELIDWVRTQKQGVTFASPSTGGGGHLAGERFKKITGLDMVHVPYKGSGPARIDLIAGHVSMMFDNIGSSLPAAQAGQLRALAVTGARRTGVAPDLPTMIESGIPGFALDTWYAIYGPAGIPKDIVRKLNAELVRVLQLPAVQAKFRGLGMDVVTSTPEELTARMRADMQVYAEIIRDAGLKAE